MPAPGPTWVLFRPHEAETRRPSNHSKTRSSLIPNLSPPSINSPTSRQPPTRTPATSTPAREHSSSVATASARTRTGQYQAAPLCPAARKRGRHAVRRRRIARCRCAHPNYHAPRMNSLRHFLWFPASCQRVLLLTLIFPASGFPQVARHGGGRYKTRSSAGVLTPCSVPRTFKCFACREELALAGAGRWFKMGISHHRTRVIPFALSHLLTWAAALPPSFRTFVSS